MSIIVPPELNAKRGHAVLVVGRDPGEEEVTAGRPFVGRAGQLLDSMLSELGLRREDVNITNTVSIRPANNDFKNHDPQQVAEGVSELQRLVLRLEPSLIIALGNEASHALVEDWPSSRKQGLTIYGAKGIEDRRGYFWDTRYGTVLTTLHPAGVLRKAVPGDYLLRLDFGRARRWLSGALPRDVFPEIKRLRSHIAARNLTHSRLVGWDIETKWSNTADLCHGFCGDDMQPYVAVCPWEFETFGQQILESSVPLVTHNGLGFDIPAMRIFRKLKVHVEHDTQHMWWALEPEIAGRDETGGEEVSMRETHRMTRKGLAFLASVYFNLPWWKNYPEDDDPEHLAKMVMINGNDAYVTRWLADCLLQEIAQEGVQYQYQQAMQLYAALTEMHLRGLPVNEALRAERHELLETRYKTLQEKARVAGLPYIVRHDLPAFRKMRKCACCGGGKSQAAHCWQCAGLPQKPVRRPDWPETWVEHVRGLYGHPRPTVGDLRKALPPCRTCEGAGKVKVYDFNPYSETQQKKLLYEALGCPKSEYKNKIRTDAQALKKVVRWAKGG